MLNKSYSTLFDFIYDKIRITFKGKIKVVEDGRERFLSRKELKVFCFHLKERLEKKQIKLLVKKDRLVVMWR